MRRREEESGPLFSSSLWPVTVPEGPRQASSLGVFASLPSPSRSYWLKGSPGLPVTAPSETVWKDTLSFPSVAVLVRRRPEAAGAHPAREKGAPRNKANTGENRAGRQKSPILHGIIFAPGCIQKTDS